MKLATTVVFCYVKCIAFFNVLYHTVVNLVFNTNSWTFLKTLNLGFLTKVKQNKCHCSAEIMKFYSMQCLWKKRNLKAFILTKQIRTFSFGAVLSLTWKAVLMCTSRCHSGASLAYPNMYTMSCIGILNTVKKKIIYIYIFLGVFVLFILTKSKIFSI